MAVHQVFVVSDGTGGTAEQMLRASLAQFSDTSVNIIRRSEVRSKEQVAEVVREVVSRKGFIVHTVVSDDLRQTIRQMGRLHDVETIDLFGPLLAQLAYQFSDSPSEKPGLFRELNKDYFQRIEAMEFAFRHDDGLRAHQLDKAEIVLVGVSRTFKTPLSIYLAFKGWLVGNVPIILNIPAPAILERLPPERIFFLTTDARHLSTLRRVRHDHFGGATGSYADLDYIREELTYARNILSSLRGSRVITVTKKPIEEIASEILVFLRKSHSETQHQ
jgi:[pyruvate, water dikinase]-phosphate phosphotransferase / [pyruvate, water dikinase] kinase